jgi:hypothetical protein
VTIWLHSGGKNKGKRRRPHVLKIDVEGHDYEVRRLAIYEVARLLGILALRTCVREEVALVWLPVAPFQRAVVARRLSGPLLYHSLAHLDLLLGADGLSPPGHAGRRAAPADRFRGEEHRKEIPYGPGAHGATVSAVSASCCMIQRFAAVCCYCPGVWHCDIGLLRIKHTLS